MLDAATRDMDVIVIGSGAAGLSAALAAHESGAERILVAEAEGIIGGSSRLSTMTGKHCSTTT
jgi:succinate dehydrogenase/fumarate reductase flavoprotein subunit